MCFIKPDQSERVRRTLYGIEIPLSVCGRQKDRYGKEGIFENLVVLGKRNVEYLTHRHITLRVNS